MNPIIGNQIAGNRNNDFFMVFFAHPVKLMFCKYRNFINIRFGALLTKNILPETNDIFSKFVLEFINRNSITS